MADFEELSFVIPGYTPETMPLDRLIEYLQQMSIVLGDPENLHLVEIKEGSVEPVLHAPKAVALEARARAGNVQRGDGTKKQVDAFNRIRRMVRRDSRDAGKPALLKSQQQILLEISAAPDDLGILAGIRQATTFDGEIIRLGGAGDDASLQVQDLQGRIMSGFTAKRALAKELASLMWEPIRLSGVGIWGRDSEGSWSLEKMQVQSYELLEGEELSIVIERLRSLDVKWPENASETLLRDRDAGL